MISTKKTTAIFFLFLLTCLLSARADGICLNSIANSINSLAVYDGQVYCLVGGASIEYDRIYRIAAERAEEIYADFSIDAIHSFSGGIVLNRSPETLDTLFAKMSANCSIEVLDPQTGETVQWDYYPAEAWPTYFPFTGGNNLFVRVRTDRNGTDDLFDDQYILKQYDAPGLCRKVLDMEYTGSEYPSFHPISIEKGIFFKDKIRLTLYDYETGAQYSTGSYLELPEEYINYSALQAVLKDKKLWYLSKDALRVYDFSNDSDEVVLAFDDPSVRYIRFTLSDERIILFGEDSHLIDVFDTASLTRTFRFTSSVSTIEYLLNDDILYLYSPYGSREIECIDLLNCTQTVVPLK